VSLVHEVEGCLSELDSWSWNYLRELDSWSWGLS